MTESTARVILTETASWNARLTNPYRTRYATLGGRYFRVSTDRLESTLWYVEEIDADGGWIRDGWSAFVFRLSNVRHAIANEVANPGSEVVEMVTPKGAAVAALLAEIAAANAPVDESPAEITEPSIVNARGIEIKLGDIVRAKGSDVDRVVDEITRRDTTRPIHAVRMTDGPVRSKWLNADSLTVVGSVLVESPAEVVGPWEADVEFSPDALCFVCRGAEHAPTEHTFWSTRDAFAEAAEHDRRATVPEPSMSAVETLDPREAIYRP